MIPGVLAQIAPLSGEKHAISPSNTYALHAECIRGRVDGRTALQQAVRLRLTTERGRYAIYGENYGIPYDILRTQTAPLLYVTAAEAIRSTLCEDDRIRDVGGFIFRRNGKNLYVQCTVESIFGAIETGEVKINV